MSAVEVIVELTRIAGKAISELEAKLEYAERWARSADKEVAIWKARAEKAEAALAAEQKAHHPPVEGWTCDAIKRAAGAGQ
jgi:hypothetical protein